MVENGQVLRLLGCQCCFGLGVSLQSVRLIKVDWMHFLTIGGTFGRALLAGMGGNDSPPLWKVCCVLDFPSRSGFRHFASKTT